MIIKRCGATRVLVGTGRSDGGRVGRNLDQGVRDPAYYGGRFYILTTPRP
jgi:hypothetical protein